MRRSWNNDTHFLDMANLRNSKCGQWFEIISSAWKRKKYIPALSAEVGGSASETDNEGEWSSWNGHKHLYCKWPVAIKSTCEVRLSTIYAGAWWWSTSHPLTLYCSLMISDSGIVRLTMLTNFLESICLNNEPRNELDVIPLDKDVHK